MRKYTDYIKSTPKQHTNYYLPFGGKLRSAIHSFSNYPLSICLSQLDSSNLQNVKLSNICLERQLTIGHKSKCDKFLHLPPEAIRSRTYNVSSEIYCLGVMLWEMWHGRQAFLEMKGQDLEVFLTSVEAGHRPHFTAGATQTSVWWSELISGCCSKHALKRNTLKHCKTAIAAIVASQQ